MCVDMYCMNSVFICTRMPACDVLWCAHVRIQYLFVSAWYMEGVHGVCTHVCKCVNVRVHSKAYYLVHTVLACTVVSHGCSNV